MCFSAEADLVAAVVVGAVGISAVRRTTRRAELPLACLPLVLAGHSLIEAFVWWGIQGHVSHSTGQIAVRLYLVIAFGVLPILAPSAVAALEPEVNRPRLAVLTGVGVVVAAILTYAVVRGPAVAVIQGHHLDYRVDMGHDGLLVALYVLVTCGSMLLSSYPHVRMFGLANLVVVAVLVAVEKSALISLWCFWAAVTSVAIVLHLRSRQQPSRELAVA